MSTSAALALAKRMETSVKVIVFGSLRPVKGNKEWFSKRYFCKKLRATTKSWQSFRDLGTTGKKQLQFRVKEIFKGFEPSIYTKNHQHINDMCSITDLFQKTHTVRHLRLSDLHRNIINKKTNTYLCIPDSSCMHSVLTFSLNFWYM